MKNTKVVGGGGAIEMELSRYLREYARTISGKQQLVINYFARALEVRRAAGAMCRRTPYKHISDISIFNVI